jgi:hypothetical protein
MSSCKCEKCKEDIANIAMALQSIADVLGVIDVKFKQIDRRFEAMVAPFVARKEEEKK